MSIKVGDILNFAYTGAVQSITLPKGKFQLECWGAQGGYRSSNSYGGKGGKSYGILTLAKPTILYIYVGGSGRTGGTSGGFNGGGSRSSYYGGGGASDIRIGTDSLYARVIVAGGGGSGFVWTGSNAPSGYLLGAEYHLANAVTKAGNVSFGAVSSGNETGHSGDGHVRITVNEVQSLNIPSKISGTWKNSAGAYAKINGVWKSIDSIYTKINGIWKQNS